MTADRDRRDDFAVRRNKAVINFGRQHLKGLPPEQQALIVAELAAILVAGHRVVGNAADTDRMREELLQSYMTCVRHLVPFHAERLHGPGGGGQAPAKDAQ